MPKPSWRDRVRRWKLGWRALVHPRQADRELEEELAFHLALDGGERGRLEANLEAYRAAGDLYGLQTLGRDLAYGARLLRRSPVFTAVAVATLGLGIGLNLALFTVLQTVLLRPLPYRQPRQLVTLASTSVKQQGAGKNVGWLTAEDWKRQSRAFSSIATYYGWGPTLSGAGDAHPQVLHGEHVSANFFPTLGVTPLMGRNFTPREDAPGRNREVLLSYQFWQRQLGGRPGVVGSNLVLNQANYQIIGVLPASFDAEPFRPHMDVQVWTPDGYAATVEDACRSCQHLQAFGRLAPGVSLEQAQAEMNAIQRRLAAAYPNDYPADAIVGMMPLAARVVGDVSGLLWMLWVASGLVLLIACANLANLMLARSAQRQREMAVRAALGAGRKRLLRQLLTEGVLLGSLGGAAGLGLAMATLRELGPWAAERLPRLQHLHIDAWTLLVLVAVSLGAGIVVGLAPALRASRAVPLAALHSGRGVQGGAAGPRRTLAAAEMALAALLAIGAGLVLRSFLQVLAVPPGFDPAGAVAADFVSSGPAYASDAAQNRFDQQLLEGLNADPSLEAAGVVSVLPLDPGNYDTRAYFFQEPPITTFPAMARANSFYDTYFVSPGYFAAMGIRLVEGRLLNENDLAHPGDATVVDAALVQRLWPGQDPIGKTIEMARSAGAPHHWARVVGVVSDVHQYALDRAATPEVYQPYTLNPGEAGTVVVRTRGGTAAARAAIERAVWKLDSNVPIEDVRSMDELRRGSTAQRQLALELMGALAVLALGLAALGIYGVVAYTTAQRAGEIGLRLALGASQKNILQLVIDGGMRPAGIGLAVGAGAALAASRVLARFTFQVSPADPLTYISVIVTLALVGVAACGLPAWRASRTDPARALQQEG